MTTIEFSLIPDADTDYQTVEVANNLMKDPKLDLDSTLHEAMDSLAYRLNWTLG